MEKTFNFMKRSKELLAQGVSDEVAATILTEEADDAELTVLDDGMWFSLLGQISDEAEEAYQAELAASQ